ncbi:hypothetical protein PISMIDRAFT_687412, partial [Pisolithus microcarpus 441]
VRCSGTFTHAPWLFDLTEDSVTVLSETGERDAYFRRFQDSNQRVFKVRRRITSII